MLINGIGLISDYGSHFDSMLLVTAVHSSSNTGKEQIASKTCS